MRCCESSYLAFKWNEWNTTSFQRLGSAGLHSRFDERSSVALKQLKQNLVEYPAVTWSDVHNRYQSKISVDDDQLGAPSGSVYPSRLLRISQSQTKKGTNHTPKTGETSQGVTCPGMIEELTEGRTLGDLSTEPGSIGIQGRWRHPHVGIQL